jgi:RHS repeat-associated protein
MYVVMETKLAEQHSWDVITAYTGTNWQHRTYWSDLVHNWTSDGQSYSVDHRYWIQQWEWDLEACSADEYQWKQLEWKGGDTNWLVNPLLPWVPYWDSHRTSHENNSQCEPLRFPDWTQSPYLGTFTVDTPTNRTYVVVNVTTNTTAFALEEEYTTERLVSNTAADLNGMSYPTPENWWLNDSAGYTLTPNEVALHLWRFQYKFEFQTERDVDYEVQVTFTVRTNGLFHSQETRSYLVEGNNQSYFGLGEVKVNADLSFDLGGLGTIPKPPSNNAEVIVSVCYKIAENSCGTSACGDLGDSAPGGPGVRLGSVDMEFGLGHTRFGRSSGNLWVRADEPHAELATPRSLNWFGRAGDVEAILDHAAGGFRQVKATQCLVDIITDSEFSYRLRFFAQGDVTASQIPGGLYTINPGATPFVTWTIENPDGANATHRLQATETRGNMSITHLYEWNEMARQWTLTSGNGLRKETVSSSWDAQGTVETRVRKTIDPGTNLPVLEQTEIHAVLNNQAAKRVVVRRFGNGGPGLEESFSYDAQGRLESEIHADGSWKTYEYDAQGRVITVKSSLGDEAPGASWSLVEQVVTSYSPITAAGDDGTFPDRPRVVQRYLKGQPVAKTIYVYLAGEAREIQCANPNGAWNDSDNLVTVRKYYPAGHNDVGRLKSLKRPDGTMDLHEYAFTANQRTETLWSGAPNGTETGIVSGTKAVTVTSLTGQVVSRTVQDIQTSIVLAQETHSNFDQFGRARRIDYLGGTFQTMTFEECCGTATVTDRDGVVTTFGRDALKRQITTERGGVIISNMLNAAGRTVGTVRIGSDDSRITNSLTGYDIAGRLLRSTNVLDGVTTNLYAWVNNAKREIFHYPGGGTQTNDYYRDGRLKQMTGTAVQPVRYEYGLETTPLSPDVNREYTKETRLDASGNPTSEWTITYYDPLSRAHKVLYSDATPGSILDNPYTQRFYNGKGQLWKERDPDTVATLYEYNTRGELEFTALDLNQNGAIDFAGTDRITRTLSDVINSAGTGIRRTRSYVYPNDSSSLTRLISTMEVSADGMRTWQTVYRDGSTPVTTQSLTEYGMDDGSAAAGYRTVTVTQPDGSKTVSVYHLGRLQSVTRRDSLGSGPSSQVSRTTYAYDPHGRTWKITDARNGTTIYGYNKADQIVTVTTPPPAPALPVQVTTTEYNASLQAWKVTQPDGATLFNEYHPSGLLKLTYGSRTYPVEYTYDVQGRMKTMKTWRDAANPATAAVTTWNYHTQRGWLSNKRYPNNTGPDYTYTVGGRLKTRDWARIGTGSLRVRTTYSYGFDDGVANNEHGDLVLVSYSNDPALTPQTTYNYNRRGLRSTAARSGTTTLFLYNDAGRMTTESHSGGILGGWSTQWTFDNRLRPTQMEVRQSGTARARNNYAYDNASRLATVTDGLFTAQTASYDYLANSPLIEKVTFRQSTNIRMTSARTHDKLNRLREIRSAPSAEGLPLAYEYQYNDASQRVRTTLADGSYWIYEYDTLGQVKSGKRYWNDGTLVAGQQFEYGHDDIGNRKSASKGGDQNGNNLRTSTYTANNLNHYTARTTPGFAEVVGLANPAGTVTVNGSSAGVYRRGEYFRRELPVANSGGPIRESVTVGASFGGQNATPETGGIYLPRSGETTSHITYDLDGNLTGDSLWSYVWDGENRLIELAMKAGTGISGSTRSRLLFDYDFHGRRIQKRVFTHNGTGWTQDTAKTRKFVYDGWNLIAELDGSNNRVRTYVWGVDLSGTMQGAGGVGGLLVVSQHTPSVSHHFVAYDGNGNVMGLINAADGKYSARYEYGPFGEPVRVTGGMGRNNPFRFSTKFTDDESGLLYYGFRFYDPSTGRWLSRDPIEERGGINVYGFLGNATISQVDWLGLCNLGDFKDAKCALRLVSGGTSPEIIDAAHGMTVLARQADTFVKAVAAAQMAGGASLGAVAAVEAVIPALPTITGHGGPDISRMVNDALSVLKKLRNTHGVRPFTRIEYKECECRSSGLATLLFGNTWKDKHTSPWKPYNGMSDLGDGVFLDTLAAVTAGVTACEEHLRQWKQANRAKLK